MERVVDNDYEKELATKELTKVCYRKAESLSNNLELLFTENPTCSPFVYGEVVGDVLHIELSVGLDKMDVLYGVDEDQKAVLLLSPITLQELYSSNNDKGYIKHYISQRILEWVREIGLGMYVKVV